MIAIGLNSDWDLMFDRDGNLAVFDHADAVLLHVKQRLRTYLGEYFADETVGVPWYQDVFVAGSKIYSPLIAEAIIKKTILDTPGVAGFDREPEFIWDKRNTLDGRRLIMQHACLLIPCPDGTTITSELIV